MSTITFAGNLAADPAPDPVEDRPALPGFDHGAIAQGVADAVLESAEKKTWVDVNHQLG
mgnify:CR=1 FL=1